MDKIIIKDMPVVAGAPEDLQPVAEAVFPLILDSANPPLQILMVEDDTLLRRFNSATLIESGYEVDSAANGAAGWDALQAKQYDLVITDNFMPKVTGFEMIVMLRGKDTALPVILATGVIPEEQLKRHPGLNINTILLKPYTIEELLAAVKETLRATESP